MGIEVGVSSDGNVDRCGGGETEAEMDKIFRWGRRFRRRGSGWRSVEFECESESGRTSGMHRSRRWVHQPSGGVVVEADVRLGLRIDVGEYIEVEDGLQLLLLLWCCCDLLNV